MKSGLPVVEAKLRAADQMSGTTRALIDIILSIYSTLSTNTLQLMREIVERKRNEATLMEAKLQAEAANLAKSQFLANMSHEIRTPLNGILGMGQLLLEPEISAEERRDYAKSILDSGKALMALLNGVLDLAAVETGDLVIERTAFAPQGLVHEASRHFREAAEHKGLGLEIEVTVADAASYLGDVARLHQMLSSLLSNAIKFTEHGFVRVAVREVPFGESATALEFSVADTGIGISPEQQDAIFHAFQQGDGSITRRFGGTGLGLAMVRSLAQLMGGTVGVESELGRGSRFWFRIGTDPVAKG
jgi:signal transduction histidine kinase